MVRGMRAADLARRVGVTANYVSLIEGGRRNPSLKRLTAIAEALGVPPAFLLYDAVAPEGESASGRKANSRLLHVLDLIATEVEGMSDGTTASEGEAGGCRAAPEDTG